MSEGRGVGIILVERVVSTQKEAGEAGINADVDVNISSYTEYMGLMIENVEEGKGLL